MRFWNPVARLVRREVSTTEPEVTPPPPLRPGILDSYVRAAPQPQTALDIFQGEWISRLPEPLADLQAGALELFDDARIRWFVESIGGVEGRSVLELGPLEGGHSYMLDRAGAAQVTAIEANSRAYLKCLIVKELLGLQRVHFLCGDCVEYLRRPGPAFDVCVASGILYHMQNPAELIALLSARCRGELLLWTHYYDRDLIEAHPVARTRFTGSETRTFGGFAHTLYRHEYQTDLDFLGFCGGSAPHSKWMSRDDVLGCLEFFGFRIAEIGFDEPQHVNGPALAIIASRGS